MSANEIIDLAVGLLLGGVVTFLIGVAYHGAKVEYEAAERERLAEEEKEENQDDD